MELARTKEWRESVGLTQRGLATEAGVGDVTVARIETGASVTPPTARKIANALGVSVADLMERPPVPLAGAPSESTSPEETDRAGAATAEESAEAKKDAEAQRMRNLVRPVLVLTKSTAERLEAVAREERVDQTVYLLSWWSVHDTLAALDETIDVLEEEGIDWNNHKVLRAYKEVEDAESVLHKAHESVEVAYTQTLSQEANSKEQLKLLRRDKEALNKKRSESRALNRGVA